jgi:hypothetical protein
MGPNGMDVRTPFPLLQLIRYLFHIFLFVKIRCDVIRFAFAQCIQLFTRLFARLCVAGGYIDFGAVLDKAFGDHATDAFRAAGYEDNFVLDIFVLGIELEICKKVRKLHWRTLTSKRVALSILTELFDCIDAKEGKC